MAGFGAALVVTRAVSRIGLEKRREGSDPCRVQKQEVGREGNDPCRVKKQEVDRIEK